MTGIISFCSIRKTLPFGCEITSTLGYVSQIIPLVLILIYGVTIVLLGIKIGVGVECCCWVVNANVNVYF